MYVSIINAGLKADADEFEINAMKDRAYILNRNLRSVMHVSFFFFQSIVTNLLLFFLSFYRHFNIFNIFNLERKLIGIKRHAAEET